MVGLIGQTLSRRVAGTNVGQSHAANLEALNVIELGSRNEGGVVLVGELGDRVWENDKVCAIRQTRLVLTAVAANEQFNVVSSRVGNVTEDGEL